MQILNNISPHLILHNKIFASEADAEAVAKIVLSGQWACGEQTLLLERELANYVGFDYCVCVASGSSALRLSLLSIGIGKDDEVIIPAYSCVCIINSVLSIGAKPIIVDVSPFTWVIDPEQIKKNITSATKAIIAVNTFGCKINFIDIAEFGIPVILDISHGFLNEPADCEAKLAIASLYATKFIGAGEGGAVFTNDSALADWVKSFRDYTDQPVNGLRQNDKMTDIEAALGRSRLKNIDNIISWRNQLACQYINEFKRYNVNELFMLPVRKPHEIWYRYPILLYEKNVDEAILYFRKNSVIAERPVENWHSKFLNGREFPASELAFSRLLSLPFHAGISPDNITKIVGLAISFNKNEKI